MARTVLVAGATGALGREVIKLLRARGDRVRALTRDPARAPEGAEPAVADARDPAALAPHLAGVTDVVSCLGASPVPDPRRGWRGFRAVDLPLNRNLIDAAVAAGVERMSYVSTHHTPAMRSLAYVDAHEQVVDLLRETRLRWSVVRPTGFFSAIGTFLDMARRGRVPALGRLDVRTNPIHDADLAGICVAALDGGEQEITAGGPEILTRRQMFELAFAAIAKEPRFVKIPAWVGSFAGVMMRPFHPRIAQLAAFFSALGRNDMIAPQHGSRTLGAYFKEIARI